MILGLEDLGKEMATHSSVLAWEIPWTEEPVGYGPWGCRRVGHALVTKHFLIVNPLCILGANLYHLSFCWILFDNNKLRVSVFLQK